MRWLWVSLLVLAGLVGVIVLLSRAIETSRSHRVTPGAGDQGPDIRNGNSDAGQKRPAEAGERGAGQQAGALWSRLYELESEESAELAPLLAERVLRLERLQHAGRVGAGEVLVARIEEALGRMASAPTEQRRQLLRSTDDWARALREQTDLLFEAGRLSVADRDEAARALEALRTGEEWLLSPRRQLTEEPRDRPAAPASPGEGVAAVRARHLKSQIEVLEGTADPDLAILCLLLRARLGDLSFQVARAEAKRQLDSATPATRAETEALVALFDWYGWARVRELDAEQR